MNQEIQETLNRIEECRIEIERLESYVSNQYKKYLENDRGIINGTKVQVGSRVGIFKTVYFESDRIRPLINTIKKDGTVHLSNTVYCYRIEEMEKVE